MKSDFVGMVFVTVIVNWMTAERVSFFDWSESFWRAFEYVGFAMIAWMIIWFCVIVAESFKSKRKAK